MFTIKSFKKGTSSNGIEYLLLEMEITYVEMKNETITDVTVNSFLKITPTQVKFHIVEE